MYTLCMRLPFMDTLMYTLCLHYSPVKADCDAYFLYTMMVIKLECYLTRKKQNLLLQYRSYTKSKVVIQQLLVRVFQSSSLLHVPVQFITLI